MPSHPDAAPPPRRSARRTGPQIRPAQVFAVVVILAAFLGAVLLGGLIGALIVGALVLGAALLLVQHWAILDPRIRVFRAGVVVVGAAVAISLLLR